MIQEEMEQLRAMLDERQNATPDERLRPFTLRCKD